MLDPFCTKQNFVCFANKSVNRKSFLVQRIFFTTKIFSTVTKVQRCRWENLEAHNVLSGDNLLFSLTAILCQVILFCRHDLRRKTLHVSDASKVAKTKNCCEPNSVFCHSANRALVQFLVFSDVAWPRVLLPHSPQEILPKNVFWT